MNTVDSPLTANVMSDGSTGMARGESGASIGTLDLLRQREAEALARTEARRVQEAPTQLFLPGIDEFMRAMPNHIARSSLFAPVARGRKKILKDAVLVSRADAVIKFWGEQLDEAQADVWMQAIHEASNHSLGTPVIVKRARFLRSIGRHVGNYEYKWLLRTFEALTFAMLVIDVTKNGQPKYEIGKKRALHLIDGFDYDEETESCAASQHGAVKSCRPANVGKILQEERAAQASDCGSNAFWSGISLRVRISLFGAKARQGRVRPEG
ncbi:hypothetical protein KTF23_27605 [Burkholderia multivorans]|uniref:hypothetical protein n=1 Tax=Burkholderia multivorans TaxID=87883 RepID=UPI001C22C317|nr:hypothetical protein [Burkholderia multivorans]MBU9693603.1 hypothetical protein [Burkholderia multivorans]